MDNQASSVATALAVFEVVPGAAGIELKRTLRSDTEAVAVRYGRTILISEAMAAAHVSSLMASAGLRAPSVGRNGSRGRGQFMTASTTGVGVEGLS